MADEWSKSGVMIRSSLAANAAHAYALVSAGRGVAFQRRKSVGGASTNTAGGSYAAPRWVRLVRSGSTVTAYQSSNGTSWTRVGSDTIALGSVAYVGIATTSHNSSMLTETDVSNVSVVKGGGSLPSTMKDADVGAPSVKGSASYNQGTYTIAGAGADIWNTSDQFNFLYQPMTGDVDVSARLASLGNTDEWAKGGVMIRETLNANSAYAAFFITAGNGYASQRRLQTGDVTEYTYGNPGAAPGYIRIKRSGSLFTTYRSTDGTNWTVIGSDTVDMADTVYVGFAVTSHNAGVKTTAVVDHLSISGQSQTNQPPTVSLTAPANGTSYTPPASITLSASASDPEGKMSKVQFYSGSTLLATDTSSPYSFTWSSVPAGTYSIRAVAYDTSGLTGTSATVSVTVKTVTTTPPRAVQFQASADHATLVTSYRLDVFASTADPNTATPIKSVSLGKPTPDSSGLITSDQSTFFSTLAVGTYKATVSAVGSGGSKRSTAVTFVR